MKAIASFKLLAASLVLWASPAGAQIENPAYLDDSVAAQSVFESVPALIDAGEQIEAARSLARLLAEEPDRLVPNLDVPGTHQAVRDRAHAILRADASLLETYQRVIGPQAELELREGRVREVASGRFLTAAGLVAGVREARAHAFAGRFHTALMWVERVADHPLIDAERAGQGADIGAVCAVYLREETEPAQIARIEALVERLEGVAGRMAERPPAPGPRAPRRAGNSPLAPSPAVRLDGIVAEPLWSTGLGVDQAGAEIGSSLLRGERLASGPATPWIAPAVVGDRLIINDGETVSAWDRLSLQPVWRANPVEDGTLAPIETFRSRRISTSVDHQLRAVVAEDDVAVAATGGWGDGRTQIPARITAFEAPTGEILWQAAPQMFGDEFRYAFVRGPVVIEEQTVVAVLTAPQPLRRLTSTYAVGIDLFTGERLWTRLIASAGVLPSTRSGPRAHLPLAARGRVCIVDPLGVTMSLDARDGAPRWARADQPEELNRIRFEARAWEMPSGVVRTDDGEIAEYVLLSPDRSSVVRIDPSTGALRASAFAAPLGEARYLVRTSSGEVLGVGSNTVSKLRFVDDQRTDSEELWVSDTEFTGRVSVIGDDVLAPTSDGVVKVSATEARSVPLALDYAGVTVASEGQLIVSDRGFAHVYLRWPVAERELRRRMAERPDDPRFALTYAQLAWRAGDRESCVPALDAALGVVEPESRERRAVFRAIRDMLDSDDADSAGVREQLVDRLGRAASSDDERVVHLVSLADLRLDQRRHDDAVAALQEILTDPDLAASDWTDGRVQRRAELTAGTKLRAIVKQVGRSPYQRFEEEAKRQFAEIRDGATPEEFEALARRFPISSISANAWLLAAERYENDRRTHASLSALGLGFEACDHAVFGSRSERRSLRAELAGRLVTQLEAADRAVAATRFLQSLESRGVRQITLDSEKLDLDALRERLERGLRRGARHPRIGTELSGGTQVLPGWMLIRPLSRSLDGSATEHVMLMSRVEGVAALWGAEGPGGEMRRLWSRPREGRGPNLVRLDSESALLVWYTPDGPRLERVAALTGTTVWMSDPFDQILDGPINPDLGRREIEVPLAGDVPLSGHVFAEDEQTVVLAQRGGRVAAIDRASGDVLWTLDRDVPMVFDLVLNGGVLAIVGDSLSGAQREPQALTLDARTGRVLHRFDDLPSSTRWCRIAPDGQMVVGLDGGVLRLDASRGEVAWRVTDPAALLTGDAWVNNERVVLLGPDRQLFQIDLESGTLRPQPLDDRGRVGPGSLRAWRTEDTLGFTSDRGMVMFDATGTVVGADARETGRGAVLSAVGETHSVLLDARGERAEEGAILSTVSVVRSDSGYLESERVFELQSDPTAVALLDGRILVTAGAMTVVYDAPVRE